MGIGQSDNPSGLFHIWFNEAKAHPGIQDATAMALATADESGAPNVRIVLLKEADERGFVFFTNIESIKGRELEANPRAALCFYWAPLGRQVRVRGPVAPVDAAKADAYFASRERQSCVGAWASKQSRPLVKGLELETRVAAYAARFGIGPIPRPAFWSGFCLSPETIEFWQEGKNRLHERLLYSRTNNAWAAKRLYP